MKRILIIALILLNMTNMFISADTTSIVTEEKVVAISPMYTHITTFNKSFDMLSGGKTAYNAYLSSSVTKDVRLYGYIQQYKNGYWTTVHSVSNLSSTGYAMLSGNNFVAKGYDYRFVVYGYAYVNGSLLETVNWISQSKGY